jgi:hypothetical protein
MSGFGILSSAMTKVQFSYELRGPVDDAVLGHIDRAHSVYGIQAVRLTPEMDGLIVEFDASRLKPEDVDHILHSAGLAVRRKPAAG